MVPCDVAYFGGETAAEVNPPKFGGLTRFRACPPAQNVLRVVISADTSIDGFVDTNIDDFFWIFRKSFEYDTFPTYHCHLAGF